MWKQICPMTWNRADKAWKAWKPLPLFAFSQIVPSSFTEAEVILFLLIKSLQFVLDPVDPRSLIPISFHGGRLFYGLHIFS